MRTHRWGSAIEKPLEMSECGLLHCIARIKCRMGLVQDREGAQHQPEDMRENLQTLGKRTILPRIERDPIFDDAERERARLEAFVTCDARTRRLSWEAIRQEMGYPCDPRTIRKKTMHEMGYRKRVPRKKFDVSSRE